MTSNLMRVVACSVSIARQAGNAIRNIMKSGNLDIVDKVNDEYYSLKYYLKNHAIKENCGFY